jgi:ABC-type polysaccharide/polyol phosphate export permease
MTSLILGAWSFVLRDYRIRFRRTLLGFFWFLVPLFTLVAMGLFLGKDIGLYGASESKLYLLRLVVGLIFWQLFADAWLEPIRLARRNSGILRSANFDQRTLLAAGVLSALVAFAIKIPVLIATIIWLHSALDHSALLLPLGIALLLGAGTAMACFTLPMSLALLDIRYAMPFVQYALLLATPIFYVPPEKGFLFWLNHYNPFSYLVPPVRDLLIGNLPTVAIALISSLSVALFMAAGLHYFRFKIHLAIAYIGR